MFGVSNEPGTVEISTHTPARGVTSSRRRKPGNCTISTHTPARGVTCIWCGFGCHLENFYSHAREGRDQNCRQDRGDIYISTHTPARGVTCSNMQNISINSISTHTPARGVTFLDPFFPLRITISTHTPARGVTQKHDKNAGKNDDFYSHAREGRDLLTTFFFVIDRFLLTRPRGA